MAEQQQTQDLRETPWHTREIDRVIGELDVDAERGLAVGEARERLEPYGRNRIRSGEMMPWWRWGHHPDAPPPCR